MTEKGRSVDGFIYFYVWALIIFLLWAAVPTRYRDGARQYLCWGRPYGQACVEVFLRARP